MENLIKRIENAKQEKEAMNALVSDYLPFLKKECGKYRDFGLAFDERLSLAMLVFVNCIRQYDEKRGNFISYLSASMKYRFLDQMRINNKDSKVISLDGNASNNESDDENDEHIENQISVQKYKKDEEENHLRSEIEEFNKELADHSLTFSALKDNCPKQKRSRKLCIRIAMEIADDPNMKEKFRETGRLSQTEAALRTGASVKSIEKYRKYIVGLIILRLGDYSSITSFIPFYEE